MGPKTPVPEGDFFRQPLRERINLEHPLRDADADHGGFVRGLVGTRVRRDEGERGRKQSGRREREGTSNPVVH